MSTLTLYGIRNCDTMKKAVRWLEDAGHQVQLHDYRRDGLPEQVHEQAADALGNALINRRSRTWRSLCEAEQQCADGEQWRSLLAQYPAMIRRPLLQSPKGTWLLGFDPQAWADELS